MVIYRATIHTASGRAVNIAVETLDCDHRADLYTIASTITHMAIGQVKLSDVRRTTHKAISGWEPVKNAMTGGEYWAWVNYPVTPQQTPVTPSDVELMLANRGF